jgi:hypothetical protein
MRARLRGGGGLGAAGGVACAAALLAWASCVPTPLPIGVDASACSACEAGTESGAPDGADGSSAPDGAPADAPADGPTEAMTEAGDAEGGGPVTYSDLSDPSNWAVFDVSTVSAESSGFTGGVFDGQYVYLVPYAYTGGAYDGLVTRYDTGGSFPDASSWSTFDTSSVDSGAVGFCGGAFDGRFVYLVPASNGGGYDGLAIRYDTTASFAASASWSAFDTTTVDPNARGLNFAAFDGRYVYYSPNYDGTVDATVARYDTHGAFTQAASWATFDATALGSSVGGFQGAAFDGRYVYFVPYSYGTVVRYDTQGAFADTNAWAAFDATTVSPSAQGMAGVTFDGRYLYFAPDNVQGTYDGVAVRYDTQAAFTSLSSWSTFDVTTVDPNAKGFDGATFDGRYVYLVPHAASIVARYDTTAGFATPGSWKTFDTSSISSGAGGFTGATFDGRYVYFVPFNDGAQDGYVLRFDARSPPALPPTAGSSFF